MSRTGKYLSFRVLAWRAHEDCTNTQTWRAYLTQVHFCVKSVCLFKVRNHQGIMKCFYSNGRLFCRNVTAIRKLRRGI